MKSLFHYSAIIDDGAEIGKNTRIWHWTHISSGSKIGCNCSLGQNVFLGNKALIEHTFKAAKKSKISQNFVLTDSKAIKSIANKFKINTEYKRPKKVSKSTSSLTDTLHDFHLWLEKKKNLL